jgi:hypothetical protein
MLWVQHMKQYLHYVGYVGVTSDLTSKTFRSFGILNKVVLLFGERWWDDHDTFGHVVDEDESPGLCYLWYCFPGISGMARQRRLSQFSTATSDLCH